MKWIGDLFTWTNKQQPATRVCSKIDRVLINDEWIRVWPEAITLFHNELFSDHKCAIVQWTTPGVPLRKPFKYCNMWASSVRFRTIVE